MLIYIKHFSYSCHFNWFEHVMLNGKKEKWICLAFWFMKKVFSTFTYIWVVIFRIITSYQMKWIRAWLKNMHAFSTPKPSISYKWNSDAPKVLFHMNISSVNVYHLKGIKTIKSILGCYKFWTRGCRTKWFPIYIYTNCIVKYFCKKFEKSLLECVLWHN